MITGLINNPITVLPGIAEKHSKQFNRINISTVGDILTYYPRDFSDRTKLVSLKEAIKSDSATVKIAVTDHRLIGRPGKQFLKVLIYDNKDYGSLLCFNRNFLKNQLVIGNEYYITGKFSIKFNEIQSSSFEIEQVKGEYKGSIVPIYPLTAGLTQGVLRKAVFAALSRFRLEIENELPQSTIDKFDLGDKKTALKNIHFPENMHLYQTARKHLIFEELFYQRLFIAAQRANRKRKQKNRPIIDFKLRDEIIHNLPFELTDYQKESLKTIENDLMSNYITSRLLMGDVGSGKTIVALLSMASVVEQGFQCALLAPTEVLAEQHYRTIKSFLKGIRISVAIMTGSLKKREKDNIISGLKNGEINIIVGTHSLFADSVVYKNLGCAVIDEQQRFGVEQRVAMSAKGEAVDILMMTATPIPRSMAMSLYGDLDITIAQGRIKGRVPVKTWLIDGTEERIASMDKWIVQQLENDERVIFVYPAIDDNNDNRTPLTADFQRINASYSKFNTAMIHSKVESSERSVIINSFIEGKIKVLAATTVVEVGLDVPNATIIVVFDADNYGLSTLHQLRGRVGRNNKPSYMIMVADHSKLTPDGIRRLEIMCKEDDGFKIAEEDLAIRGPGDFLGNKQSGLPDFKIADITSDIDIFKIAMDEAEAVFTNDPDLVMPENQNVKKAFLGRIKGSISGIIA